MKTIFSLIISGALVVSGYTQTRNVLVGTNNAVVQPTNFWSADASNARTGLGLGSAATNNSTAFQPSSTTLSNLSLGNGAGLTNVTASSVSSALAISNTAGLQAALDGKLATNGSAAGLISFPTVVLQTNSSLSLFPEGLLRTNGNALGLTNFPVIPVTSGGTGGTNAQTARNGIGLGITNTLTIAGVVAQNLTIESGGGITLQSTLTNAASFRTNIGLPWSGLTSVDAPAFRTALGLGTAATSAATAFQASSANLTNLAANNAGSLTNLQATSLVGVIPSSNIATVNFSNLAGTLSIASGGTSATNAANARQNLGSTTVGDAVFIATNAEAARTAIGALATNGDAINLTNFPALLLRTNGNGAGLTNLTAANVTGTIAISNGGSGATTAGGARTNLGLGATWLTNTNATNFRSAIGLGDWATLSDGAVIRAQAITISDGEQLDFIQFTTGGVVFNGTAAGQFRTALGLGFSALTNTNTAGFNTSLYGSGTNPVLYNTNGEVVSPTNFWQVAPIQTIVQSALSTGATNNITNNATNARNLYLYSLATNTINTTNNIILPTNTSTFGGDNATIIHQGPTSSVTVVRQAGATNNLISINRFDESVKFIYENNVWAPYHNISFQEPIYFSGTNAAANVAATRTNLGLPLPALTNTNNANFRTAIELGTTNSVTFSNVTASGTLTSTGVVTALSNAVVGGTLTATGSVTALSNVAVTGTLTATSTVTAKTNLVVEGFVNFSTNNTNSNPAINNQINDFIEIRVGTNQFWLPVYK